MYAAGGVVDHADQVQLRSPIFQPGVLAGIPLDQFADSRPALPPLVDLLHSLALGAPQFAFDHPLPHRLAPRMNAVFFGQIFRRQSRAEPRVDLPAQYLQRGSLDFFLQLAIGSPTSQRMHDGLVAFGF
jgi:hypothetical protein